MANPALDDFLARDGLAATLPPKMRESAFRRARLCQFVDQHEEAWLPLGACAACADATRSIPDGADVVAGFDGSFSRDYTALVVATVEAPHVELVELWEAPEGRRDWRVPVVAVEDAIRAACVRWRVVEVAADPYRWQRSLEVLDGDGVPVHEFFQTAARMGPATARFHQLVVDQELTHTGDSRPGPSRRKRRPARRQPGGPAEQGAPRLPQAYRRRRGRGDGGASGRRARRRHPPRHLHLRT